MKVGDLVWVRQDIDEFVDVHGKVPGIIIEAAPPKTNPQLVEVHWSSGDDDFEKFYSDELEVISESR
tara:strand:- start:976 stop:1176 length:201 start_codon:yes stop_codon:yes gene_type:complete